ncbi:ATP synthase F1 subunit gamma [Candidatus Uhrbacteria bacterium CG_4_10_14_0_8_um_filter_58_22]|uniref:ATP synthase gamma chain n=1 Tax=Candidatus Uhrbacteria bacterium CG_4_10_14_0_8_um_filter_58_22 TaxID=1975029 RepID=A0A2M7Q9T2_9BACT|nr:MAG: ATP synthase F1 subunit gamma [Parcubacteria group bacterium CG1_02_58_44]PIY62596.1 MAG: ATP synthase F1 subunit gamma [Candidatus Uhrbacteria bacterium CG_4_10_14_0_8_um_filter_58_22]
MAISTRLIRRRIKSVTSTRKITKAMELVAASKMRRAVSSVLASRPYAEAVWTAIREMAKVTDAGLHPLLSTKPDAERVLVVLFTSERGLCGGFNSQLLRQVNHFTGKLPEGLPVDFVTVGRKGQVAIQRQGLSLVAVFNELASHPTVDEMRPIADLAVGDFVAGKYRAVYLAFTDYVSALVQKPRVSQLLPVSRIEGLGEVGEALTQGRAAEKDGLDVTDSGHEYLFEPSPSEVLDVMLPRLIESQVYQALLESSASEHSARMLAMRTASDSAEEMIDSLTLSYNQTRQAGITAEIAEISSGKAALEKSR